MSPQGRLALPGGGWAVPGNRFDLVPETPAETPAGPPSVTVVIPHYQAQSDLDLVLTALTLQTHPRSRLQVVVADDGSAQPPTVTAAEGLDVRLVSQPRAGFRAAAARNLGAAAAEGDVLCFLDGDTVPDVGYVEALTRLPAVLPDALVVGRREHTDFTGWDPARLRAWLDAADLGIGVVSGPPELPAPAWLEQGYARSRNLLDADDRSFRFVISAVLCLRLQLFREIGEFEESFTSYGGEDWELGWRAWCGGAVLAHEPGALAWHNGPDWAGRDPDPVAKNAETLALARLIAEPLTRGRGLWQPYPQVVATLPGDGSEAAHGSAAARIACLDSLLALGDVGVWSGAELGTGDPRVHVGPPPADVVRRARVRLDLHALCTVDAELLAGLVGRAEVYDETGPLLTATTTRAASRAARWGTDALFPVSRGTTGATRLPPEPDLARLWAGW